MTQVNRITGGSAEFINLIKRIEGRVSSLETKGTGPIFVSDQIITADPTTGVETIFGALPNGGYGLQQWVNDETPPDKPVTPVVAGNRAVFEITWNGLTVFGTDQPEDYDRTVVQMATPENPNIWTEETYLTAAGRTVVGGEPYGEERFFRLISYDKNGNASLPSDTVSATLVSFMESPEMTTYINEVETSVSSAASAASKAQSVAQGAAEQAASAEKLAQAAASSATSMVKNGSFEFDFESWTKEDTNGTITTTTAYEGTKSWEIGTAGSGIYQEPIAVNPGDIFVYEMYYKTIPDFAGSGGLRLQTSTNGTDFTNAANGICVANPDWVSQSIEYTIPTGVTHIRPRIAFAAGTTMGAWVDSVKLTDVTSMRKLEKLANDAKAIADAAAQDAEDAARDAGIALTAANGKNTIWRQPEQPAGTAHKVNDTWFDTDNENKIHLWNGTIWEAARDEAIDRALSDAYDAEQAAVNAASAAATASGKADTATSAANDASEKADNAFTAANGKNKITPSFNPAPVDYVGVVGDMWWQKSTTSPFEIIKQSTWTGSAWEVQVLGNDTIANLNAGKLNAGTIAADRIGANTVTSEKILVGSTTNLVTDPTFTSALVWTANRQTTGGKDGGGSLLIPTGTTQRGFYFGDTATTTKFRIPVNSGGKYRVNVWVQTSTAASANTISIYGKAWKSTATTTTTTTIPGSLKNSTSTVANVWYRITGILEIPAGYDRLTLGFYAEAGFTGSTRFSNPVVQEAATGELIVDGAITTLKMAADSITAESGIIASLDASKITVGELEGARLKAGSIFADRLVVGSGDNLIVNPEFTPNSALTNARLAASTAGIVPTTPDYVGWNKATASAIVHSFKLGGQVSDVTKPVIPVIANRRYKINWTVYADVITSTGTRVAYRWMNRNGTITPAVGATQPLTAVGVTSYSEEIVAPAEATHVCIDLEFTQHPGGGWLDFRQPSMQLMTDGTIITEDAVMARHIRAGEITGDVLDMGYIKGQVITGTMFEGQTFTGGQFQSATFETSPLSATGIKMSPTLGLIGYGADNQPVFQVDTQGNAAFTGTVNITAGSVPESVIPGLTETLDDHEGMANTVWAWTDPTDRTLIHGGNIATNTITANKVALGSGQNFIPGGFGENRNGWEDFDYAEVTSGWPSGVESIYSLTGPRIAYSPPFNVAGLNKYSFSYTFVGDKPLMYHMVGVAFYDINDSFITMYTLGRKTSSDSLTFGSGTLSNQTAPSGAVNARIYVEHNWETGDTQGTTQFGAFKLSTGVQTMLTASGLSSYSNGMQTVRINGENNLLIGEFMAGRPGIEPYIKLSSNASLAAMNFYGVPGGVANHGAMWYNQGSLASDAGGGTWGFLSMYAIDDSKPQSSRDYYAAGIELTANQRIKFQGKLDIASDMIKSGCIIFNGEFGGSATGEYEVVYPRAFPDGTDFGQLSVHLTMVSSGGAPLNAVVTFRDETKFKYRIRNMSSSISSGATRMNWMVIRNV